MLVEASRLRQSADFASLLRHSNIGYEGRIVAWLRRLKAQATTAESVDLSAWRIPLSGPRRVPAPQHCEGGSPAKAETCEPRTQNL